MLGQMPMPQTIALLRAMKATKAAELLVAMPADRMQVLLAELPGSELARLFPVVDPARQPELLDAMPAARVPELIRALPLPVAVALVAALPAEQATRLVGALPAEARTQLASALPADARTSLYDAMTPARAGELASAVYERRALAAVVGMAAELSRPSPRSVVVDVLGGRLLVVVRPDDAAALDAEELHELVVAADWTGLDGLLVVTDAAPTDRAAAHAGTIRASGYRLELQRWADERDDGLLKRALVRLAAPAPAPAVAAVQAQWSG